MKDYDKVKFDDLNKLLVKIFERAQECAPTKLQFGYTDTRGGCNKGAIVILDCAPAILTTIREFIDKENLALRISVGYGGVVIR